jgi:desulfoferrodoxin-like iron-binding protein
MASAKPGQRFRCAECGTEVVVIKPGESVPSCCGQEMENASSPSSATTAR